MKEKIKCKKCGLLIDEDSKTCPYCGYEVNKNSSSSSSKETETVSDTIVMEDNTKRDFNLFKFESREIKLPVYKNALCFVIGFLVINVISLLLQLIIAVVNPYYLTSVFGTAMINFSLYLFIFGAMLLLLNKDALTIAKYFLKGKTRIKGLCYGALLIAATYAISYLTSLIGNAANITTSSNVNEQAINSVESVYPIGSLIIFGIIGPICEELTYRVGLFSLINKKSRVFAYIVTIFLFSIIHFNISTSMSGMEIANEFLNLPSYMLAGFILCYVYDREGAGVSIITHVSNNVFALLMFMIAQYLV